MSDDLAAVIGGFVHTSQIGMRPTGEFVVAWLDSYDPYARRFGADASPLGDAFGVNSRTTRISQTTLGLAPSGEFVLGWRCDLDGNIYARQFDAGGLPLDSEFLVNTDWNHAHYRPRVSVRSDGEFVLLWDSDGQDGNGCGVYGKRFRADGSVIDGEFMINTTRSGHQYQPDVATTDSGKFVAVWASAYVDESGYAVCAQLGDAAPAGTLAAQDFPYTQDFESGEMGTLAGWELTVTRSGTWEVTGTDSPHGGSYHLKGTQSEAGAGSQQAVLKLDLASEVGRTDLELDFWARLLGTSSAFKVSFSGDGDGRSWTPTYVVSPEVPGEYTHITFDLDRALAFAGMGLDGDVYVKLSHCGSAAGDGVVIDDVRVADLDLLGPRVIAQSPAGSTSGPVAAIDVTFDEQIDASTFTAADVTVTGPASNDVPLAGDPVDSGDHRTFTISLAAAQLTGGLYRLTIRSEIRDPAGNWLNQDGDPLNGETNGEDDYQGTFRIDPIPAETLPNPHTEGFEAGQIHTLPAWDLYRTSGSITVSDANPHDGTYALEMYDPYARYSSTSWYQSATLHVDLSSASNVTLDFWANHYAGGWSRGTVYVSADGANWTTLLETRGGTGYQHYALDLDASGLSYSNDVQIKFRHIAGWAGGFAWDDIQVGQGLDVFGASIVDQTPSGSLQRPVSSLTVTFNEDMDTSSFTADDVLITGPGGAVLPLSGDPGDSGDHRTFTITFAEPQTLAGLYHVTIGPDVLDLAGNPMNQNGDNLQGDAYNGTFTIEAEPAPPPVVEGFEVADLTDLGAYWSFERTSGSTFVSDANPHSGTSALQMYDPYDRYSSTSWYQSATLHMDLRSAGNVTLDFWATRYVGGSSGAAVFISVDGTTWTTLDEPGAAYQHYAFDLHDYLDDYQPDEKGDVQIKFRHISFWPSGFAWDDIRVATGIDVFGASIVDQMPSGSTTGPVSGIEVTFSEDIDASSFTAADVTITDPVGNPVALSGAPADSGDHRKFTISFATPQALAGVYGLAIGPNVLDLAGNPMNQDGDPIIGETNGEDTYISTFGIAGITVSPVSGLVTSEAGDSAQFTVVLESEPAADVTIGLSSDDATEGTVSPASLTFTPTNWSVAQTVTVTGVDDLIADGDVSYAVVTAPAASTGPDYDGLDADDIAVINLDNDAAVLARHVFYNNSYFDGEDPAANAADDGAIAPHPAVTDPDEPDKELGKEALLPGGAATFANYTSYSRGINGIMVDIAGLANPAGLSASDFRFRVGNDDNPNAWTQLTVAPSVTVRPGAGANGSDRVTLIWPDGTIQKQWLQVTALVTANTGLPKNEVFYFGNAIGESGSGNASLFALVTVTDELGARHYPHTFLNRAAISDPYDFNRDSYVTTTDELTARSHGTSFLDALRLITVPSVVTTDDQAATDEDTAVAIVVLANDRDEAGAPLTVYRVDATSALGAALTLNPDNTVQYDPSGSATLQALTAGQTAEDTFTYTIRDSLGGTDTARVLVTVTGLDESSGSVGSGSLSATSLDGSAALPAARLEIGVDVETTNDSVNTWARDASEFEPSPGMIGYSDVSRVPSAFRGLAISRLLATGDLLDLEDAIRYPTDSAAHLTSNGNDHIVRLIYAHESRWSTPPGGEPGHNGGQRAGAADHLLAQTRPILLLSPGCRAALDRILEEEPGSRDTLSGERASFDPFDEADAESWRSEDDGDNDHCAEDATDVVLEAFGP